MSNLLKKDEKLFYLKKTNDIIVLNKRVQWWDNFHLANFAEYVKKKFHYNLHKINMN